MLERELPLFIADGETIQLSLTGLFRAEMALGLNPPRWHLGLLAASDRQLLLLSGSRRHLRIERAPHRSGVGARPTFRSAGNHPRPKPDCRPHSALAAGAKAQLDFASGNEPPLTLPISRMLLSLQSTGYTIPTAHAGFTPPFAVYS
jgi:hypothetical protein